MDMFIILICIIAALILIIAVIGCCYVKLRRQSEREKAFLVSAHEVFLEVFDSLSLGFSLKDASDGGRYIVVNNDFAEIHGLKKEDFLNKSITEIKSKDIDWIERRDKEAIETGQVLVSEYHKTLGKNVNSYRTTLKPFNAKDGHPYILDVWKNISAEKAVQDEFAEYRTKLELTLNTGGMNLWEYDVLRHRMFFTGHDREIFGESVPRESFLNLVLQDDRKGILDMFEAVITEREENAKALFRISYDNNDYRWFSIHAGVLKRDLQTGLVQRLVGIYKDVTEEQSLRQQLDSLKNSK
ncbi:MAG: PAS domain S-box protein [Bacteroidaceae bacterium]|nr:PAS domain S-box protein [Bacteroidaceae bacterium]MBP9637465.1 PAS domain S-box protein [Bacteroidaceae bacterium]